MEEKEKRDWIWAGCITIGLVVILYLGGTFFSSSGKSIERGAGNEWFIFAILALGIVGWIGYRATNKKE